MTTAVREPITPWPMKPTANLWLGPASADQRWWQAIEFYVPYWGEGRFQDDIVRGYAGVFNQVGTAPLTYPTLSRGAVVGLTGINNGNRNWLEYDGLDWSNFDTSGEFTVLWAGRVNDFTDNIARLFSHPASANNFSLEDNGTDMRFQCLTDGSGTAVMATIAQGASGFVIDGTAEMVWITSCKSGSQLTYAYNLTTGNLATATATQTFTDFQISAGLNIGSREDFSQWSDSDVYCMGLWSRAMNEGEMRELMHDPFLPIRSSWEVIIAAAAAGGIIPQVMHHRRMLGVS